MAMEATPPCAAQSKVSNPAASPWYDSGKGAGSYCWKISERLVQHGDSGFCPVLYHCCLWVEFHQMREL